MAIAESYHSRSDLGRAVVPLRVVESTPEPSPEGKTLYEYCIEMRDWCADVGFEALQIVHSAEEGTEFWNHRAEQIAFTQLALELGQGAIRKS